MNRLEKSIFSLLIKAARKVDAERRRRSPERSLHNRLWERATEQSADFVEQYLDSCLVFEDKPSAWRYVAGLISEKGSTGTVMEFGVASGVSINALSKLLPEHRFFGFDSFIGLKEDWAGHHATKGAYSQGGKLPKVNRNVELISGWFDESIPQWLENNSESLRDLKLLHIDGDTYEAAVAVFDELGEHLKPGMFVLFDELIGYPNWQNGELKALLEASERFSFTFKYRAFSSNQGLIEIT